MKLQQWLIEALVGLPHDLGHVLGKLPPGPGIDRHLLAHHRYSNGVVAIDSFFESSTADEVTSVEIYSNGRWGHRHCIRCVELSSIAPEWHVKQLIMKALHSAVHGNPSDTYGSDIGPWDKIRVRLDQNVMLKMRLFISTGDLSHVTELTMHQNEIIARLAAGIHILPSLFAMKQFVCELCAYDLKDVALEGEVAVQHSQDAIQSVYDRCSLRTDCDLDAQVEDYA